MTRRIYERALRQYKKYAVDLRSRIALSCPLDTQDEDIERNGGVFYPLQLRTYWHSGAYYMPVRIFRLHTPEAFDQYHGDLYNTLILKLDKKFSTKQHG